MAGALTKERLTGTTCQLLDQTKFKPSSKHGHHDSPQQIWTHKEVASNNCIKENCNLMNHQSLTDATYLASNRNQWRNTIC